VATATAAPALSDEDLAGLLELTRSSDSVELKLTVPESDQRSTIAALGMDPVQAQIRQVYFFDTPDLALNEAGVVVRARRVQRKGDDCVVKLRPVVPAELPDKLRKTPGFVVEVDALPGGYVCSGSLKSPVTGVGVRDTVLGGGSLRKMFSKQQRAYYTTHAPEGVELDDLSILGPLFVLKLKFSPPGYERKLVAEMWLYPDDSRIVELSTKCAPGEAFQVAAETKAYLLEHGVDLSGEQQTKTKKALDFFSKRLRAAK
jgi:hypothetical protein